MGSNLGLWFETFSVLAFVASGVVVVGRFLDSEFNKWAVRRDAQNTLRIARREKPLRAFSDIGARLVIWGITFQLALAISAFAIAKLLDARQKSQIQFLKAHATQESGGSL